MERLGMTANAAKGASTDAFGRVWIFLGIFFSRQYRQQQRECRAGSGLC
jgi:hypothetical protein